MMNPVTIWYGRWLLVCLLLSGTITLWLQLSGPYVMADESYLSVSFLDVGQGDAIFIETPERIQVLIDGGPDASVIRELADQMPAWDRYIDVVIATHPDKDHIAGLVDVLERYEVGLLVVTENHGETDVAKRYYDAMIVKGIPLLYARAGQSLTLGASTTINFYSPADNPSQWESNASSIVVQVVFGDVAFLLPGDVPLATEDFLVRQYGERLQSNVLKLGHHGSRTSTSKLFAQVIAPDYAVVSAGRENSYGHPHEEPVTNVLAVGASVLSTAEVGTIRFLTDGDEVWLE